MQGVEFKATPSLEELKEAFKAASAEVRQTQEPHSRIAVFLDQWVQDNFKSEGGNVGGWQPFAFGGRLIRDAVLQEKAAIKGFQAASTRKTAAAKQRAFNKASASVFEGLELSGAGSFLGSQVDPNAVLLQDTGRLRASFIPFATSDNAGIGSKVKHSKYHNEGGRGGKPPPQRRILPEMKDDAGKRNQGMTVKQKIESVFRNHVVEIMASKDIEVDTDD